MAANSYFEVLGGFLPQHLKIGISPKIWINGIKRR